MIVRLIILVCWAGVASAQPLPAIAVKIEHHQRGSIATGSGTIVAANGTYALVLTCRHILDGPRGRLVIERTNHRRYEARPLAVARDSDLATLVMRDPGGIHQLGVATAQHSSGVLCGFPRGAHPARKRQGAFLGRLGADYSYSFRAVEGDSGGGVFSPSGELMGVAWGTSGTDGAVVNLTSVRGFLGQSPNADFFRAGEQPPTAEIGPEMTDADLPD